MLGTLADERETTAFLTACIAQVGMEVVVMSPVVGWGHHQIVFGSHEAPDLAEKTFATGHPGPFRVGRNLHPATV